ncbi:MAG: hypothetical protein ABI588_11135, partial [Arenimonas sp.]
MLRLLPLLLLVACAVDKSSASAGAPASTQAAQVAKLPTLPQPLDPMPLPAPPVPAPADGRIVLAPGEQTDIAPQATLRYDKLLTDS